MKNSCGSHNRTFLLQRSLFSHVTCVGWPWIMTALQLNHVQSYLGVWVQNTHPCWGGEQVMDGWMNKILFVMILFPLSSSEAVVQDDFFFSGAYTSGWKANFYIRDLSVGIGPTHKVHANEFLDVFYTLDLVYLFVCGLILFPLELIGWFALIWFLKKQN